MNFSKMRSILAILVFCWSGLLFASLNQLPQVVFIFDASGSMMAKAGSESKINIAKKVMDKIVPSLPKEVKVGLAAYGHRRKGDCKDIEMLIPPGSDNKAALLNAVHSLKPKGKTPIAATVSLVADKLKSVESETTIVLVSDGEETCNANPCEAVKKLKESGIKFILHVIGFAVNSKQKAQLECLAKAGGGRYYGANDASGLLSAFKSVKKEVEQKVIKAKSVTKKAVLKIGKIKIFMPELNYEGTLKRIKVVRKSDKKEVGSINNPKNGSVLTVIPGEYEVIAGYANSNYHKDSEIVIKDVKAESGKSAEISFGAVAFNVNEKLKNMPADYVILENEDNKSIKIVTGGGNDYYFYKTKAVPEGRYSFYIHYGSGMEGPIIKEPVKVVSGIEVKNQKVTTVNIVTGFKIKKPANSKITRWQLIPKGKESALLDIKPMWNGNDYHMWQTYGVMPGKYSLVITVEGMSEPLTAAEDLEIKEGEIVNFDTGL